MDRHPAKLMWGFVRLSSLIFACGFVLASGCAPVVPPADVSGPPKRIVSLDYCADQFVLKLANRDDIIALSTDATRAFSYLRREAQGIGQVRATSEDVLALKPDLIVRSYGGGPNAEAFFKRAGVKVHQIGWGDDFDAVRNNVRAAALAMGQEKRGQIVVDQFDQRLAALTTARGQSALYLTPSGVTTGPGSMVDLMMRRAGLTNFQTAPGWQPIALEALVLKTPDMITSARFGAATDDVDQWSVMRHPVIKTMLAKVPVAEFDGATTTCAGWFVLDGVEAMAATGRAMQAAKP
jgi:iron complex transport system substrate-binding protein